jgi:hypothetical protein
MSLRAGRLPAMITVVGDEKIDFQMMDVIYETIASYPLATDLKRMKTFTIVVGKKEAPAQFYVNNVQVN